MTDFNSKRKLQKIAVIIHIPQTMQNLARHHFAKDGKEKYRDL